MGFEYEAVIELGEGIGHIGASALRDGVEDALQGCVDAGEEAFVSLDSDSRMTVVVRTGSEMGDNEASMLRDAIAEAVQAGVGEGETFTVGEFAQREGAAPAP